MISAINPVIASFLSPVRPASHEPQAKPQTPAAVAASDGALDGPTKGKLSPQSNAVLLAQQETDTDNGIVPTGRSSYDLDGNGDVDDSEFKLFLDQLHARYGKDACYADPRESNVSWRHHGAPPANNTTPPASASAASPVAAQDDPDEIGAINVKDAFMETLDADHDGMIRDDERQNYFDISRKALGEAAKALDPGDGDPNTVSQQVYGFDSITVLPYEDETGYSEPGRRIKI